MTLRRAAFPERVGPHLCLVYLLWLEAGDILGNGGPRPLTSTKPCELKQIVDNHCFHQALAQLPSGVTVEIAPSVQEHFYVRVLLCSAAQGSQPKVIPLPSCVRPA